MIPRLTRAIVPLLASPGLQTASIHEQLSLILARYAGTFLHEVVNFARTNQGIEVYDR